MTLPLALQCTLFPLDPWGCESVFAVINHPHPSIARAVVGPLIVGRDEPGWLPALRCIAVDSSRHFLFDTWIPSVLQTEPEKFWSAAADQTEACVQGQLHSSTAVGVITAKDSVKAWSSTDTWIPEAGAGQRFRHASYGWSKLLHRHHVIEGPSAEEDQVLQYENLALAQVNKQLKDAMDRLLEAVVPELRIAYVRRPRLATGMVNRLLCRAQADGMLPTRYMLQAIKTEAFGLLHLMAFDDDMVARGVLQAVLRGASLSDLLGRLGISKGVYRRTLRKAEGSATQMVSLELDISDMHLPGARWFAAMRLSKHRPVSSRKDWHALSHLLWQVQLMDIEDDSLADRVMAYCVKDGYVRGSEVLAGLSSDAKALVEGAQRMASATIAGDDAIRVALEWQSHEAVASGCVSKQCGDDPAALVLKVCRALGLDSQGLMQGVLNYHPCVPSGFSWPGVASVVPLNSIAMTLLHGAKVGNCLKNPYSVVSYIASGVALYAIECDEVAAGTVALMRDTDEREPKVEVLEVSGQNNKPSMYALGGLAQALADHWNAQGDIEPWSRYSAQCRRLAI